MSIVKLNNRGVKNATAFGSISSLGSLTLIQKQTASSSATIDFTTGIDSTYKEYIFYFVNIHPATDQTQFTFQGDTGTNTNYNQTITSTHFRTYGNENGTEAGLGYNNQDDQAQGTAFQVLAHDGTVGNANDESLNGSLHIFNPSSSVFVKHFIGNTSANHAGDYQIESFIAGYFNTQTALTRFRFKFASGNIDSGDILLFGLN